MKIIKTENYEEMSLKAAQLVRKQIKHKKDSIIIFPTGNSPLEMYSILINYFQNEKDDWSHVIAFNLDEYYNIPRNHETSYFTYMHRNFYDLINIKPENIHIPNGELPEEESVKQFTEIFNSVKEIDLAILGIGQNGHIGFNEPGTPIDSKFRKVELTESTIKANSIYFSSKASVPKYALSMGIADILRAKKIILLASCRKKAEAIFNMVKGPVTDKCPASFLQTHKHVTVIVDKSSGINI